VVACGGFDPSGGAGVVRDFVTARTLGARATLVLTAWTSQTHRAVQGFEARPGSDVARELVAALTENPPGVGLGVKIGMVGNQGVADALVAALEGFSGPIVYDPVLRASSGGRLFNGDPGTIGGLLRRATLITPNADEAANLAERSVDTVEGGISAARRLLDLGARAVLLKGGHLGRARDPNDVATDILVTREGERLFTLPRVPDKSPRGTGCALATAIAVELARGQALARAVEHAKGWLHQQIHQSCDVDGELLL
jgi:hydroxymethylpyrimidine/phosphomethylpyrimidine kinase